ncbi:MAG: hypothetical protein MJ252_20450 [archaeon]|nr:hypothetical protein [archaeon]
MKRTIRSASCSYLGSTKSTKNPLYQSFSASSKSRIMKKGKEIMKGIKENKNRRLSQGKSDSKRTLEEEERELQEKCFQIKMLADKVHKANIKKTKENQIRDKEIDNLNDEIQKLVLNNYDLEQSIQKELVLRRKYEKEQTKVAKYCNDLKHKFNNLDETVKNFEKTIKTMKDENKKIKDIYDEKIKKLEVESKGIEQKINDKLKLIEKQKEEINEQNDALKAVEKEIEVQRDFYETRKMENKMKYTELEKQNVIIQKEVHELQMQCEFADFELSGIHNKGNDKTKSTANQTDESINYEQQIQKYEQNNLELMQEIERLTQELEELNNSPQKGNYYTRREYGSGVKSKGRKSSL